ncbi:MAG: Rieske (2Fe-2S) protein [Myxococcales bacterium]|nr:Rieske (2Fe-2S) protein [Myxococcales bacterium]
MDPRIKDSKPAPPSAEPQAEPHAAPEDERAEARALRAFLTAMELRDLPRTPAPEPVVPFEALPAIAPGVERAIAAAALAANDRYLETFLEPHSFCPFSRGGRSRGLTQRYVHYAATTELEPLYERMLEAAREPGKAVVQVILPLVDVAPDAWCRFCHALTAAGNDRLRDRLGCEAEVFAVAPLHPELPYLTVNPHALIPLFRRTPDPTIQWVRLDALDALYSGRSGDTVFVDPGDIAAFLATPRRTPLYDRIAETNLRMAARLGIPEVERTLREMARAARDSYARILLSDEPPEVSGGGCPRQHPHAPPVTDTSPPRPALFERDGKWALLRADELAPGGRVRVLAQGVEVVAVRSGGDLHVLHGRCPHRHAPLSDAVVEGDHLVCPHHGWDFDLATGRSTGVPGASVARFRAWVDEGLLWVEGAELGAWTEREAVGFRDDDDVL